jgi:hypothetical protein
MSGTIEDIEQPTDNNIGRLRIGNQWYGADMYSFRRI